MSVVLKLKGSSVYNLENQSKINIIEVLRLEQGLNDKIQKIDQLE